MATEYSIQSLVSDGTLSTVALGIQYLQRNDIYMRIAGEETPQSGAPSGYTWSFVNNTTLKILPVVPNGVGVVIYRRTDIDAMYNIYSQNAQFDETTIDENNEQLLYIAQEYLEQGIPGAGVETLEYINTVAGVNYYRFRLTDGSVTNPFGVPDGTDVLRSDLAGYDGAGLIGSASYAEVRAYTGPAKSLSVYGIVSAFDGAAGMFYMDTSDTTSQDNNGTILVDALGRRWKRQITGDFNWRWWGVKGDGVADDYLNIKKMIASVNRFSGPAGVFAISQSLPLQEGLVISIWDNAGSNTAGLIKPHASVSNPSTFDFFFANSSISEHIEISGLRFFGGRHVIRGNFPNGVASGYLAQLNFEGCVFQELAGYVIEATNSAFVVDFHKCRLLRCGGVNIGYGVNILKFRQCGFENMRREYIKLDGAGSSLPSASIGMYGCRCEGYDSSPTASKCFDIKGDGRLFNFEIKDGTYFENVFTDIGTFDGIEALDLTGINFTNSDNRVYTMSINNSTGTLGNVMSLVNMSVVLLGTSVVTQTGPITGGVSISTSGTALFVSDSMLRKSVAAPSTTPLYKFKCTPTGNTGATVFSAMGGQLKILYVSSRTTDGTPIYLAKTFEVVVSKMFGGNMVGLATELGSAGNAGGGVLAVAFTGAVSNEITLALTFTGSGAYSAGAVISASLDVLTNSVSENTIFVTKL